MEFKRRRNPLRRSRRKKRSASQLARDKAAAERRAAKWREERKAQLARRRKYQKAERDRLKKQDKIANAMLGMFADLKKLSAASNAAMRVKRAESRQALSVLKAIEKHLAVFAGIAKTVGEVVKKQKVATERTGQLLYRAYQAQVKQVKHGKLQKPKARRRRV